MNNLILFYLKESPNCDGLWLEQIWNWPDSELEFDHSWCQHLFPTAEPSMFNADAPLLDATIIEQWHKDNLLQHNLRKSYERWLVFCGLKSDDGKLVLIDYKRNVWSGFNHNWLRITRILRCLTTLGLSKEAQEFYTLLEECRESLEVNDETWAYWTDAVLWRSFSSCTKVGMNTCKHVSKEKNMKFDSESSIDEILDEILKDKPAKEQVRILRSIYNDAVGHGWVDDELRESVLSNLCREYKIPFHSMEDEDDSN